MFWDNINEEENSCGVYHQCSRIIRNQYKMSTDFSDDDKENMQTFSAKDDNELSLYETSESNPCNIFEDPNSIDSGYAATNGDSPKTSSLDSFEDGISDISELNDDERTQFVDFNKLLHDPIKNYERNETIVVKTKTFKRSVSMFNCSSSSSSKVRSCLFKTENELNNSKSCKRTTSTSENQSPKRFRVLGNVENIIPIKNHFSRSISSTEDSIKSALQRESIQQDLIGDFSKQFCLPLTSGRHQDLKSITPTTLAMLIKGEFNNNIASFKVIDCRYPYEYNGGHVDGAINLYTKQQILDALLNLKAKEILPYDQIVNPKRHILIFHCEFSSERGPNLSRFLRNIDRIYNKDVYPFLHYPEIYLLDGGYKCFYEQYSELCVPNGYLPMLHPEHVSDLRHFRAKSKTFNCDTRLKPL